MNKTHDIKFIQHWILAQEKKDKEAMLTLIDRYYPEVKTNQTYV